LGWYWLKVQLLQSLSHHALGQLDNALSILGAALARAEPEGYVRIFVDEGEPMRLLLTQWMQSALGALRFVATDRQLVDYANSLLAAFSRPASQPNTVETVSAGETPAQTTGNGQAPGVGRAAQ
jgi:LuxR family maltose regulon positive regulatory protein